MFSKFDRDGLLVLDNFLDEGEVKGMKNACDNLVENMDPEVHRGVFSATAKDNEPHV